MLDYYNRMAAAKTEFNVIMDRGYFNLDDEEKAKLDSLMSSIDQVNSEWEQIASTQTATVTASILDAQRGIAEASLAKQEALSAKEKELRWAISSIWNIDVQDQLNDALTIKSQEAQDECARIS